MFKVYIEIISPSSQLLQLSFLVGVLSTLCTITISSINVWRIVAVSVTTYLIWIYNIFSFSSHQFSIPRTYKVPKIASTTLSVGNDQIYTYIYLQYSIFKIYFQCRFFCIFRHFSTISENYPLFTLISSCFLIFRLFSTYSTLFYIHP